MQGDGALHGLSGARGIPGVLVGDGQAEPAAPVVRRVLGLLAAACEHGVGRGAVDAAGRGADQLVDRQASSVSSSAASALARATNWVFFQRNQIPITGRISTATPKVTVSSVPCRMSRMPRLPTRAK